MNFVGALALMVIGGVIEYSDLDRWPTLFGGAALVIVGWAWLIVALWGGK
jgi:hypothetical protein